MGTGLLIFLTVAYEKAEMLKKIMYLVFVAILFAASIHPIDFCKA